MISYNQRNFESMRQDAMKRIREMHKHSQAAFERDFSEAAYNASESKADAERKDTSSPENSKSGFQNSRSPQGSFHNQPGKQSNGTHTQQNRSSMGNPFAQLFGSNMGGFNRFKQQLQKPQPPSQGSPPQKKDDDIISDVKEKLGLMLKDFKIDDEKIILGLLIYVLYKNKADFKLLIALAYLII